MMRTTWVVSLAVVFFGCPPQRSETPTSGHLSALVTESLAPLIQQEAEEFQRLYPEVSVTIGGTSTRGAIVQLINDSVSFIIVDRPFNQEEREVVKQYAIEHVETKVALDALVVLVNNRNPTENITLYALEQILSGKITNWRNVPESRWSGPIDLVLTPINSGAYELLATYFFQLSQPIVPRIVAENQHAVFRTVAMNERALGFISLAALNDTLGKPEVVRLRNSTRALAVSGKDSVHAFHKPHQANVYRGYYPLRYPVYLYSTAPYASLATGFSAFIASVNGQKIIQNAGLVPATMPVRLIQTTQEPISK
jgi:phosphate transport system substrate-binding protein